MCEYLKYSLPEDVSEELYFVPVVFKNKDHLVGFVDGMFTILDAQGISIETHGNLPAMGSDRFNDILRDGRRIKDLNDTEFRDYVKEMVEEQMLLNDLSDSDSSEFKNGILDDFYFYVTCTCGNFVAWNSADDVPENNINCDMCDRLLIHYTGHNDNEFEYDGTDRDINLVINAVLDEMEVDDEGDE